MNDKNIVRMFLNRDENAIKYTFDYYGRSAFATANRILNNKEDSEECVNDALLKIWNSIPPENPDSLIAYFKRITRNTAIDRYYHNTAEKRSSALTDSYEELSYELKDNITDVEKIFESEMFSDSLNLFLRSLKKQNRIIFVKRYWYGKTIAEISDDTGYSESKIKSSLMRTRNKFKDFLSKEKYYE